MEIRMHFALLVGVCFGVAQAAEQPIHIEIADLSHVSRLPSCQGARPLNVLLVDLRGSHGWSPGTASAGL